MKNEPLKNNSLYKETDLKQELSRALHQLPYEAGDPHLQATILLARKEACRMQTRERISFARFLKKQIPLIGWKLWGIQGVFLAAASRVLSDCSGYLISPPRLARLLFCLSVVVFMTALPLLYRSIRCQMQEIEAASRFSSVKLLLAKLIVIGIGDIFLLGGLLFTATAKTALPADIAVIYLCLPFLLACGGCLFMLGHFPPGRFLAGSTLFCFALLLLFLVPLRQSALLFHPSYQEGRIILCVWLSVFCACQLRYIIKTSSYGELQII